MNVAVLLFEGVSVLQVVSLYEVFAHLPGVRLCLVATAPGEVTTDTGCLRFVTPHALGAMPEPDVVVVPGSSRLSCGARFDPEALAWVGRAGASASWAFGLGSGVLDLAEAGVLDGHRVAAHWRIEEALAEKLEAVGSDIAPGEPWVVSGRVATGMGVSAGYDVGLQVLSQIHGPLVAKAIQLAIEYDPAPPFEIGGDRDLAEQILTHSVEAKAPTEVALYVYEGMTATDAMGPYEILSWLPGVRVRLVAKEKGPITTDTGFLSFMATDTIDEVSGPDILLVPGSTAAHMGQMLDEAVLAWVRRVGERASTVASVCTGSLILGAAGLLEGKEATTHWMVRPMLSRVGASARAQRVVHQGRLITGAGVSAGMDLAFEVVAQVAGEQVARAIQLALAYDPRPPFDVGALEKAPPEVLRRARRDLSLGPTTRKSLKKLPASTFLRWPWRLLRGWP